MRGGEAKSFSILFSIDSITKLATITEIGEPISGSPISGSPLVNCINCIKGLSDELSRILRKFNINVYTYPYKTIRNILPKIKDSVDDIYKRGAIYKIPCKDCSNVYVGETGRCFNTRLSEYKRDLKPINLAKLKEDDLNKKTALVKHCFNCEHRIDFGNFEILDYNIDYDKRKFLESLYINNTKNSINDKDRNVFPKIYSNIKNLN